MNLIFELSKEFKELPKSEILSCLKSEKIRFTIIDSNSNVLVVNTNISNYKIHTLSSRLSMTFFIDELLFSCPPKNTIIIQKAKKNTLDNKGSIAISCKNRSKKIISKKIINELGDIYSKDTSVNLTNPKNEIRFLLTDQKAYLGVKKTEIDRTQFEKRKVQYRPFFSPISLHPKIARVLVNLSEVRKNQIFLDPFCGTGGILIEAGLIGTKLIGSDIEKKMIYGCKKTLDFYNIKNYKLYCCDIGDIKKKTGVVDAIATDFPYGKSTTTKGEGISQLYERAFENISKLLKKGSRAVIGLSNKEMIPLGEKYLSLIDSYEIRVHRSLTRYFVVYQK